jgi:hypothetical protein
MATSNWSMTLENNLKNVMAFVSSASNATFTRTLNAPAELTCDLDLTQPDTKALFTRLDSGAVYARLSENVGSTSLTRFFGVLTDVQAQLSDDSTVTASFMDLSQQYATSFYYYAITSSKYCLRGYDGSGTQTTTVTNLMTDFTGAESVLLPLTVSGTASGSRQIEPGQEVSRLEILDGLASVEGGIDWYVDADDTLVIANTIGQDLTKKIRFQYGQTTNADVLSADVQHLPPRNRVLTSQEDGVVKVTRSDATSIANFGHYEVVTQRLQRGVSTETDVADQLLRTAWRKTVNLQLEPSLCKRPWWDYNLGDTVKVKVVTPAFTIDSDQRINQFTYSFDEQFVETGLELSMEVR